MATTRGQQIGIWIIASVLTVGTVGSFLIMILASDNSKKDTAALNIENAVKNNADQEKAKQQAQAAIANSIALNGYSAAKFDATSVTALQKEILVSGTGDEVKATDTINVSYFGWTSDGVIFDSSTKKDTGKDSPISLSLAGVIKGWTDGLTGQRVGSTIKLTIPGDLAYGAQGSGPIGPNAPLIFIVTIHAIETAPATK